LVEAEPVMGTGIALAGALGLCLVGGFLPWVNTEAAVVGAALVLPAPFVPLLVVGAALAQVLTKGTLYGLARWAPQGMPQRARAQIGRLSGLARRNRYPALTILASSTVGVPPFYLVTLASGTVAVPFGAFLAAAFVGSFIRYAVLSLATVLMRGAT
jgi:membrane protein YqaA with SNARE-associated domain